MDLSPLPVDMLWVKELAEASRTWRSIPAFVRIPTGLMQNGACFGTKLNEIVVVL